MNTRTPNTKHLRNRVIIQIALTQLRVLFKLALRAILRPHRAFRDMPAGINMPYRWLLACLAGGGLVFVILHFGIAQGRLLLRYPFLDLTHIVLMPFFSIWIWMAGSLGFYLLARFMKQKADLRRIELGAFYIWIVWLLMPLIDLPHLLFDIPFVYIFGVGAHISWLFAFIWMPLLSYFLIRDTIGLHTTPKKYAALFIALSVPLLGRFGIEQLPHYLSDGATLVGMSLSYFSAAFITVAIGFSAVLVGWLYLKTGANIRFLVHKRMPAVAGGILLLGFVTINLSQILVQTNLPERLGAPISPSEERQITGDFGIGLSRYTNSHTWTSSDYETGTVTQDSLAAESNIEGIMSSYDNVVDLDFDPSLVEITEIRCNVNFTSNTDNFNVDDNSSPLARCDIQPDGGSWQEGSAIGPLNSSSGLTTWTWSNPTWGNQLSQSNNSVRVWGYTQGQQSGNDDPVGDILQYNAVTVEIDYEADITQDSYRWFENADALDPGPAIAAEDTSTIVENREVVRLRTALRIDTGLMDADTEAFQLQYTEQDAATCEGSSGWSDVGDTESQEAWRGYENSSVANGAQITSSLLGSEDYGLQTYQEDNSAFNNPAELNQTTPRGEWDWVIENHSAPPNTDYCFRIVKSSGHTLAEYDIYPEVTTADEVAINQAAYRWFTNVDLEAGDPIASQDELADAPGEGSAFRLRMLLDIEEQTLFTGDEDFKLQYAEATGETCSSDFSQETYVDVETDSGPIRFYDHPALTHQGTPLSNPDDPSYQEHNIVYQTYLENNPFTIASAIPSGSAGLWDFSLEDHSASPGDNYCFRVVSEDDNELHTYTEIPQITTVGTLDVGIVDDEGQTVLNPSFLMSNIAVMTECQESTGQLGTPSQRLRVTNDLVHGGWGLSIAATDGPNALWEAGSLRYDFNDPAGSPAGCAAGGDNDIYAGQMSIDPSTGSISAGPGCSSSGLSLASPTGFEEGVNDTIQLLTADFESERFCDFFVEGVDITQTIPPEQPSGQYSIDMTLTIVSF